MMVPLNSMFNVTYGNKFDLNKMVEVDTHHSGINFVGRSSRNHGVSARVKEVQDVAPYQAGCITVALGGTKLLASFVQPEIFYTAQNVAVLRPIEEFSFSEKLYICLCIRHNRFRYSAFGREANRTLRTLLVPARSEFPNWVYEANASLVAEKVTTSISNRSPLDLSGWADFNLSDLFDIRKGRRVTRAAIKTGETAFISAIDSNNGLRQRISLPAEHPAGVITVNYNGNGVAEAFFQPEPFVASDDVNVLYPRQTMDVLTSLFLCTVIRREKYRFSYGRKWTLDRMRQASVKLPATEDGLPDWVRMRAMIKNLTPGVLAEEIS